MIHHYTSIETLALILSNRTIRFNRSDRVDDASEAKRHADIKFGSYFFVSCWTHDLNESIPQWHMYTDRKMKGVRLTLPNYPFKRLRLKPKPGWDMHSEGELYGPIPFDQQFGRGYYILPTFLSDQQFGGPVEYRSDVAERYRSAVAIDTTGGRFSINIAGLPDLARLKTPEWSFQHEYRFVLCIFPSIPVPDDGPGSEGFPGASSDAIGNALLNGTAPPIEWFDVSLSDEALSQATITMGPMCSEGDRVVVNALVEKYIPHARVVPSQFTGTISR